MKHFMANKNCKYSVENVYLSNKLRLMNAKYSIINVPNKKRWHLWSIII